MTIVAMLSVPQCFIRPRDDQQRAGIREHFAHLGGDHLTMLKHTTRSNKTARAKTGAGKTT